MYPISVVITCFNNEKYIEEAVASIFTQTLKPLEVIVIDGGSSDGTMDKLHLIKNYMLDNHLFSGKITIESHDGFFGAHARNQGVKLSSGEWIYFLDGDDIAYPDTLEVLLDEANRVHPHMVYGGFKVIGPTGIEIGELIKPYKPILLVSQCYIHTGAALIHRNVFNIVGFFDESLHLSEDIDFWCRMVLADCRIVFISRYLMKHRHHRQSICGRGRWKMDVVTVLERYYRTFKKKFSKP